MKPVVIQYPQLRRQGAALLAFFGVIALIFFCLDTPNGWIPGLYAAVSGVLIAAACFLGSGKSETFSEAGICIKGLTRTRTIPWDQVIQAGIVIVRRDYPNQHPGMAFTFTGGKPRKRRQRYTRWLAQNSSKTALCVACSQELRELALRCYGPLDFDEWRDPEEQSTLA